MCLKHRRRRRWQKNSVATVTAASLLLVLCASSFLINVGAECCYPKQLSSSRPKCGDGSTLRGRYYCGQGDCNFFGCNCVGGCRSSESLRFKAGDIIGCEMVGLLMGVHTILTFGTRTLFHTMLAVSDHDVIHVSVDLVEGTQIKRESFFKAKNDKMHCHVETEFFDEQAAYYWDIRPFAEDVIVARAEAYEEFNHGRPLRYDAIEKNCEHWVTFWRYGIGFNLQLHPGQPTLNGVLRYFGLRPKLERTDNFEGHHRISWNGTLTRGGNGDGWSTAHAQRSGGKARNFYVGPLFVKPKYSGICWRNSDCYSKRCDRTDVFGHEFGYCEVIKFA